jgi:diguanylate cyclase (GGDEF)-like protein
VTTSGAAAGGSGEPDGRDRRRLLVSDAAWGISFIGRAGAAMCCSILVATAARSGRWLETGVAVVVVVLAAMSFHVLVRRRWRSWRPLFTHAAVLIGELNLLVVVLLSPGNVLPYVSVASFTWVAAFAGLYLSRRLAALHVVLMNALVGVALGVGGDAAAVWTALAVLVPCTSGLAVLTYLLATELRRQTEQDPLTGLPNRRGLASRSTARRPRRGTARSVVALDLDRFKEVNDSGGHDAGDRLLVEVAERWSAVLGADDFLARTGGDEFVLLHAGGPTGAAAVVEELRRVTPEAVGVTAGVAVQDHDEPFAACLRAADAALYSAKGSRRGTTVVTGGSDATVAPLVPPDR